MSVIASWKTRGSARVIYLSKGENGFFISEYEKGVLRSADSLGALQEQEAVKVVEQQVKLAKDIDGITFKRC